MNRLRLTIKFTCILLILNLFSGRMHGADYTLALTVQDWKIKASGYYIKSIIDERKDKSNGFALQNSTKLTVVFPNSIESDILSLINSSASFDTSGIPLIMSFETFILQEKGIMARHTASLNVKAHFYREHDGKRYEIVELESKPSVQMGGPIPHPQEDLIQAAMKDFISGLNKMISESPNMPQMVSEAKIIFDALPPSYYSKRDTLFWSPNLRLKWSDFKGQVPDSPFSAESSCIFNYTAFTLVKNKVLEIHIQMASCFNTNNSWVRPDLKRDTLLMHEQLHFDICETEIRKLKKTLGETTLDPFGFDQQIHSAFNEAWERYKTVQHNYDEETQHGIVLDKQSEWMNRIGQELELSSEK